jgi:hypothetical protein
VSWGDWMGAKLVCLIKFGLGDSMVVFQHRYMVRENSRGYI